MLLSTVQHPRYLVRRAGYRGLTEVAPEQFEGALAKWSTSTSPGERKRAAEAWVWMRTARQRDDAPPQLASDQDPEVREAASKAGEELRARKWSDVYLAVLTFSSDQSNEKLLRFWRYGEAPRQLGDDDTLLRLRQFAKGTDAIHVLTWLEFVADGTRKHWREIEKNWE